MYSDESDMTPELRFMAKSKVIKEESQSRESPMHKRAYDSTNEGSLEKLAG